VTEAVKTLHVSSSRLDVVITADDLAAPLLNRMFGDFSLEAHSTSNDPDISVAVRHDGDGFSVTFDDGRPRRGLSRERMLDIVIGRMNRLAVDHAGDRLSLHAAVMCRGENALLIAGDTGAGKSTAALGLMRRGWEYVTDEIAWVAPDARSVTGLGKPLTVKRGTRALFPDLEGLAPTTTDEPPRDYLRATDIGQVRIRAAEPNAVAVLRPESSKSADTRPLNAMEAVTAVVENAFDVDRLGGAAGLRIAAALAARCPVVEVCADDLETRLDILESTWTIPRPDWSVRVLDAHAATSGKRLRWVDGTHGVEVNGTAILRLDDERRLVTIDPMPAPLWEALDGTRDTDAVIHAVAIANSLSAADVTPDIIALLQSLETEGVVRNAFE
jgi:hypothetical protein